MENNRQTRKKRKHYLNDFRQAVNGEYIYTGDHYSPEMEQSEFSRFRMTVIIAAFISAVLVLAAGMLPSAGSLNCFYVILPFLAVIICCFIKTVKTVRLFSSGFTVREYIYEKTVPAIPGWLLAECISSAATLTAEAVYLILNGFDGREIYTAVFICLITANSAVGFFALKSFRRIIWEKKLHN